MRRWVLTAACAAALGSGGLANAASTYYVATNGNDTGACGASGSPCKTVQFAIDKTADGDTVRVKNGTFKECIFVVPGTGVGAITLAADTFLSNNTVGGAILDGTGVCDTASGNAAGPVAIVFDKCVFKGFAVKNGGDSGVIGVGAVAITNNAITGNTTPTIGGGIFLLTGTYFTDPLAKMQVKANTISTNTAAQDGAGIYLDATADGVPNLVEIDENVLTTNVSGPDPTVGSLGGAITVFTNTINPTDQAKVVITSNTISGNTAKSGDNGSAAYGGGIFVATFGYGTEEITIGETGNGNSILNNVSGGLGGGISANLQPGVGAKHTITIEGNSLSANTGKNGGGGVHAFLLTRDPLGGATATFKIEDNAILSNVAQGQAGDAGVVGGGGVYAELFSNSTPAGQTIFEISGNELRLNTSTSVGGGASLLSYANDDPDANGVIAPAAAEIDFQNNLLAANKALKEAAMTVNARGGGAFALAVAIGDQAVSKVDQDYLTVVSNETDAGAGGLEWEADSLQDSLATYGKVEHELTNSIIAGNELLGVGGLVAASANIDIDIRYDDGFGNGAADGTDDWESQLGVVVGTNGISSVDPTLDPLYFPPLCSATIDLGDPALAADGEPEPNGGVVNLGHLGGGPNATRTFPDINGDGIVDGIDILRLAIAYNAPLGNPRFNPAADLDLNDLVDGADLAFLAAFYGSSCP